MAMLLFLFNAVVPMLHVPFCLKPTWNILYYVLYNRLIDDVSLIVM